VKNVIRPLVFIAVSGGIVIVLSSCARHEPPEDTVRSICASEMKKTLASTNLAAGNELADEPVISVLEIGRKGVGESKNTRGIPDKTLVYTIACLIKTTIGEEESEPENLYLYFYKDANGNWTTRERM